MNLSLRLTHSPNNLEEFVVLVIARNMDQASKCGFVTEDCLKQFPLMFEHMTVLPSRTE